MNYVKLYYLDQSQDLYGGFQVMRSGRPFKTFSSYHTARDFVYSENLKLLKNATSKIKRDYKKVSLSSKEL